MGGQNLQQNWHNIGTVAHHVLTCLIQINWQALWLSILIVGLVAILQFFGAFPKAKYSRWRLGLLLTATLIPFLLCLWTWASAFVRTGHYPAPYLWQMMFPEVPRIMRVSVSAEQFVILSYCAWLLLYPLIVWSKAASANRLLRRYADNAPYWATESEQNWQNEVWDDLLRRFSLWRKVRVIEIEEHPPMTVGFFRPVIVVPDGINESVIGLNEPARFRAVMAHELAHIRCDSLWMLIHRVAVWLFPLPQVPVWLFNRLRKRFVRLQMDTGLARHFIGPQTVANLDFVRHSWVTWRPLRRLLQFLRGFPDPAPALVGVEFERHADFVAVRVGDADHDVLRETLVRAALWEAQAGELADELGRIVTPADRERVLERIQRANGEFEAFEDRLNDLPSDAGVSLWTKILKALPFLAAGFPFAITAIPLLLFLAETGSELTRPPVPGFAQPAVAQVVAAPAASSPSSENPAPASPTPTRSTKTERPPPTTTSASISVREIVHIPVSGNREVSATPSVPTSTQPTPLNTAAQDGAQRVAALNEQGRTLQANLSLQQRADAAMQRQQNDFNRAQSALDSLNRSQSQLQTTERSRQSEANFDKANQQMQQTTRFINQAQAVQSSQMRQQTTLQNAIRVNAQAQQNLGKANALNNSRLTTPYIPSAAATPPKVYTPPPTLYAPPRTYSPPPISTPAHTYTPPPMPYIPSPTPH